MDVHPASNVTSTFGGGHFTGRVWLDLLLERGGAEGLRMYRVFFEPGSRTHWHAHPDGQSLMILVATARAGAEGEPAVEPGPAHGASTPPRQGPGPRAPPEGYMIHGAFNPG